MLYEVITHVHPDTQYNSLSVAIIGIVKKDCVIRSDTANPGDLVIAAYRITSYNVCYTKLLRSLRRNT